MKKDNKKIIVLRENEEVQCDVLFTVDDEKTGKRYIIYTDNSYDNGVLNIYASSYNNENNELGIIDNVKEQKMIEKIIDIIKEEVFGNESK